MRQPTPESFGRFQQPSTSGPVTAYFLGTSSILLRDSTTAILIDGFVSRPGLTQVLFNRIGPDTVLIDSTLKFLGIDTLAAVVTTHSDYDHAMDAPAFARRGRAVLVGSQSTRQIGVGGEVDSIRVVRHGDTVQYGDFHLTFVRSRHGQPHIFRHSVTQPLRPPRWVGAWKSDTVYAVLIRHRDRAILVNGSSEFDGAALDSLGVKADVVYLASSGLARRGNRFVDGYWRRVVRDRHACRVILVHWDNFFRGLDKGLKPVPWPFDSFGASTRHVTRRGDRDTVDVRLPEPMIATDPFAGLEFETGRPCRWTGAGGRSQRVGP